MDTQEIMKTLFATALCAAGLFAQTPTPAPPNSWRIDPLHSQANFTVRHMMISTVRGTFGGVKGTVIYDPKNPTASSIEATIDATTINTGEPKRDNDLKSEEFFDIKKYPVLKFKSKSVAKGGEGILNVTGDLTINAVTKQVLLKVEGPTESVKDTQGRTKIGASATTKISRKEYGILYNPVMETGGVVVSDEVSISLDIELIKN